MIYPLLVCLNIYLRVHIYIKEYNMTVRIMCTDLEDYVTLSKIRKLQIDGCSMITSVKISTRYICIKTCVEEYVRHFLYWLLGGETGEAQGRSENMFNFVFIHLRPVLFHLLYNK